MFEFFTRLFDPGGFNPRKLETGWTPELVWLHTTSDILIWLACLAIPLFLGYLLRGRNSRPIPLSVWVVCAAILAIGLVHAFEAVSFHRPIPRAAGLSKAITAACSWIVLIIMIMGLPRFLDLAWSAESHRAFTLNLGRETDDTWRGYVLALVCVILAAFVRLGFNQFVGEQIQFDPFLLAIVISAWYGGVGPGLVSILGSTIVASSLFQAPDPEVRLGWISQELSLGFFVLSGVAVTLLSESEKAAKRRAESGLWEVVRRREELEAEIRRRETVEKELRQREESYRQQASDLAEANRRTAETLALLDTFVLYAPVGMAFIDHENRLLRVNQALSGISGRPPLFTSQEEHQGHVFDQAFPELAKAIEHHLEHVRVSGESVLGQVLNIPMSSGSDATRILQVSCFPVSVGRTSLIGTGLIVQNITDEVRVDRELRASEARFRSLAEIVPQFVWEARADGQAQYFNQRWYEYTGLSPDESLGEGWANALDPQDRQRTLEHWHRVAHDGNTYEVEYRFRDKRGKSRWFLGRGVPERDADGSIVRWLGTCTDIEDLKHAQQELVRSEQRFRLLSETIPQIVWTATPQGEIDYFSPQWYDYCGSAPERSVGDGWFQAVHSDDLAAGQAEWRRAYRESDQCETQARLRRASDGSHRWHLIRGVPLRDAAGTIVQWVGTMIDIDDQKRQSAVLENLVHERTIELERSNRELELFASIASHDLQEPLRKIQAFGDRLQHQCASDLSDTGRDYLQRILGSAGRMRNLINDLLTFSRVTTNARPFAPVDLDSVVRDVLGDIEDQIMTTGGRVEVDPLPSIDADATQMRQLFQNLISNGLKFHKEGVPPIVRISARLAGAGPETGHCEIRVEDNGIGFDTVYGDRIFQVFQRLHGRSQYEGTGIGLAICRKITERHRGQIFAESTPGVGSTFVVSLPARQAMEEKPEHEPALGEADHDSHGR
jgi:PAS domain S-box-containing protein